MRLSCVARRGEFVLDVDISFESRVASVFGPSGSGKTTLLDCIAGLREIELGEIEVREKILFSSSRGVNLPPSRRTVGYVPQETALFPHLTVEQNVLFGWRRRSVAPGRSGLGLRHVAEVLEIERLLHRPVADLSGGEAQRVALARAILSQPALLLLDEPLASLDVGLKGRIMPYLSRMRDEFSIPMIYVTHDRAEVLTLADWVIVLQGGRLLTQGEPRAVLTSPSVLSGLADDELDNILAVRFLDSDPHAGRSRVSLASGREFFIPYMAPPANPSMTIRIRGDDILLATRRPAAISAANVIEGVIVKIEATEGRAVAQVDAGDLFYVGLTSSAVARLGLAAGSRAFLVIKARSCAPL